MGLVMSKRWRTVVLSFVLVVLAVGAVWFGSEVRHAKRRAVASASQGRLNQLLVALHNYHDTHGSLPPAFIADENGNPMHSWRVLILPFIDQSALFNEYRFDEPWNGPNNAKLAKRMPVVFHQFGEPDSHEMTNIVLITGPGTAFPGAMSVKFDDIRDGLENTILATEIGNSTIPWLEPRDLSVETMSFRVKDRGKPSISCPEWRQPYVVFGDSISTYTLRQSLPAESLRALMTISGGEAMTKELLESQNHISRRSIVNGK